MKNCSSNSQRKSHATGLNTILISFSEQDFLFVNYQLVSAKLKLALLGGKVKLIQSRVKETDFESSCVINKV